MPVPVSVETPDEEPIIVPVAPDLVLPKGQDYWTTDEMDDVTYSVQDVAKFFFGMTAGWLRWRLDPNPPKSLVDRNAGNVSKARAAMAFPHGWAILEGERLEIPRTPTGARAFRLYDIERLTHAFLQTGAIDGQQFLLAMRMVKAQAQVYRYLS